MPEEKALWRTRDFRNCEIVNYLKAADYITSKGGFVLRMGAIVDQPLPDTGNPKIIDYASHQRTDFLDIYLPSKCRFFLGCDSGIFMISTIFDVPVALANCNTMRYNPFQGHDLFLLTLRRWTETGELINFDEALRLGYFKIVKNAPNRPDIETIENTPEEILDLAREMIDKLEGNRLMPKDMKSVNSIGVIVGMPGWEKAR